MPMILLTLKSLMILAEVLIVPLIMLGVILLATRELRARRHAFKVASREWERHDEELRVQLARTHLYDPHFEELAVKIAVHQELKPVWKGWSRQCSTEKNG